MNDLYELDGGLFTCSPVEKKLPDKHNRKPERLISVPGDLHIAIRLIILAEIASIRERQQLIAGRSLSESKVSTGKGINEDTGEN